jgi:hypothetical protein
MKATLLTLLMGIAVSTHADLGFTPSQMEAKYGIGEQPLGSELPEERGKDGKMHKVPPSMYWSYWATGSRTINVFVHYSCVNNLVNAVHYGRLAV